MKNIHYKENALYISSIIRIVGWKFVHYGRMLWSPLLLYRITTLCAANHLIRSNPFLRSSTSIWWLHELITYVIPFGHQRWCFVIQCKALYDWWSVCWSPCRKQPISAKLYQYLDDSMNWSLMLFNLITKDTCTDHLVDVS